MNLKYMSKNDGYIIDRKFTNADKMEGHPTHIESGRMILSEVLPIGNEEMEKAITEYAFDNMKDDILTTIKKKYAVSNEGIYNFYFEGNVEKNGGYKIYANFGNEEVPVVPTNFNVDFEVEIKVTPRNFLKIKAMEMMEVFTM